MRDSNSKNSDFRDACPLTSSSILMTVKVKEILKGIYIADNST